MDDLLDIFDRDRGERRSSRSQARGFRGLLNRLMDHDDDPIDRRPRYRDEDDDMPRERRRHRRDDRDPDLFDI